MSSWDKYFYDLCVSIASNSKCLSRQVGAIIVRDKSIISTGYNGAPRGIPHCDNPDLWFIRNENLCFRGIRTPLKPSDYRIIGCPRKVMGFKSGEGLEFCVAGHGERNSIVNAARLGIPVKGASMYMNCGIPCTPCFVEIINAGISELICTEISFYDEMSKYLAREAGIPIRTFDLD